MIDRVNEVTVFLAINSVRELLKFVTNSQEFLLHILTFCNGVCAELGERRSRGSNDLAASNGFNNCHESRSVNRGVDGGCLSSRRRRSTSR